MLTLDNVCNFLEISLAIENNSLYQQCRDFICENCDEFASNSLLHIDLEQSIIMEILSWDELGIDEIRLLEIAINWSMENGAVEKHFDVFKMIRFGLIEGGLDNVKMAEYLAEQLNLAKNMQNSKPRLKKSKLLRENFATPLQGCTLLGTAPSNINYLLSQRESSSHCSDYLLCDMPITVVLNDIITCQSMCFYLASGGKECDYLVEISVDNSNWQCLIKNENCYGLQRIVFQSETFKFGNFFIASSFGSFILFCLSSLVRITVTHSTKQYYAIDSFRCPIGLDLKTEKMLRKMLRESKCKVLLVDEKCFQQK